MRGLGAAGAAHARGMWEQFSDWTAGDLRLLRAAAETLDRVAELRAAIATSGGTADGEGRAHPLLRHVRAELMVFGMLMRPLQPRADGR
jgi:hypothetical protein